MNPAHLHLIITHLPVFGSFFGVCLLLLSLRRGSLELKQTSLWTCVLSGVLTVPAYLTGRPASTLLMKLVPVTSLDASDQHAEIAVIALVCALLLGALAIVGLVVCRPGKRQPAWLMALLLVLGFASTATMTWTASLGGKIRHSEVESVSEPGTAR